MLKNLNKYTRYISSLLMATALLALPFFAFGQDQFGTDYLTGVGLGTQDVRTTIINIIRIAFGILGIITLVLIVYAGVIWMTSGGKQETIAKAKKIIINAIIGLIIILLAWGITEFIFRQITTATSTDGTTPNTCAPANSCLSACTYCNAAGIRQFDQSCGVCTLGSNAFELREVQTAHGGTDPKQDVYLCSRIQPRFNNAVDASTVLGNVRVTDISGVEVSGAWNTSGNTLQFVPDNNFAPNSSYEVRISNTLADSSGDFIAGCNGTVCESVPPIFSYYGWQFTTGVDTDTIAPSITSAYPNLNSTDITVSRAPTIDVTYSESIDFLSIADGSSTPHPQVSKFILQALDGPGGVAVGAPIDNAQLVISSKANGFRVKIDPASGTLLDGFTWYRITVQDVIDLCGNNQQPSPQVWEFETNDSVPGITSYSPTGANSCPSQTILFSFGTAMYGEQVVLDFNGQMLAITPDEVNTTATLGGVGTLSVLDPSFAPNPVNGHYRNFEFVPSSPLTIGTTYNITVSAPNLVIDGNGNTVSQSWQFTVADASSCTCAPYITSLSPSQGNAGQCLTVNGRCFSGSVENPGSLSAIHFVDSFNNTTSAAIQGQDSNYATTDVPASLGPDTYGVEVTLTYNDANYGSVTSDASNFVVTSGAAYTGPCLYAIDPGQACHGALLNLTGTRFGADPGSYNTASENVNFSANGNVPAANFSSWSDTNVRFSLPTGFQDSDVSITVGGQTSNTLPFDVSCGVGAWCSSSAAPICTSDNTLCTSGSCNAATCQCEATTGTGSGVFRVVSKWPGCTTACPNSSPGISFSEAVDGATVTANSSILIRECLDGATCNNLGNSIIQSLSVAGTEVDINAGTMNADTYYRAIVTNSVMNSTGLSLGGLNYSVAGNGINDAYSWIFKTDIQACDITGVDIVPDTMTFSDVGQVQKINGRAMSSQGCFGNEPIIVSGLNWFWSPNDTSGEPAVVTHNDVNNDGLTDSVQYVEARSIGNTEIIGSIQGLSFEDRTPVQVNLAFNVDAAWPTCETACINSELGLRFSSAIDTNTISSADFELNVCNDGQACNVTTPLSVTLQPVGVDSNEAILNPSGLQLDSYHQIIVHGSVQGLNGAAITNVNYDTDNDQINDAYAWVFKTSAQVCDITGISVYPGFMTFNNINQTKSITGKALSSQGCIGGQYINAWDYNWDWAVHDANIFTIQSPLADLNNDTNVDPVQSVTSQGLGIDWGFGYVMNNTTPIFTSRFDVEVLDLTAIPTSCDGDPATPICEARSSKCSSITYCNPTSCACETPPAPTVLSVSPTPGSTLQCSNTAFEVIFDQPMKTQGAQNYFLLQLDNYAVIDINVKSYAVATGINGCTWPAGCTGFIITPTEMVPEVNLLELFIEADISSIYDQTLGVRRDFGWISSLNICNLDSVRLLPTSWMFTSNVAPDNSANFIATGYSNDFGGNYIVPSPNYAWDWSWTETDPDNFINMSPNADQNTVTAVGNGQGVSYITARADITTDNVNDPSQVGTYLSATAQINTFICEYPWPDPPPYNLGFNAYLMYCRGNDPNNLLPNINTSANLTLSDPDLDVDRIFSVEGTDVGSGLDVIGLRIYRNPSNLSAYDWYNAQDFPKGSPQSTYVNRYEAIVDGRSTYIYFANINGSNVTSYILLLSYNQDAQSETLNVYRALLKNIRFNTNIN